MVPVLPPAYGVSLILIGATLIIFRRQIADLRNRTADEQRDRWGKAEPRRYVIFGLLFVFLGISSLLGLGGR
jgi:hypothetical protein